MTVKQLSVFVENKQGRLAEIVDFLGENQIDIKALCIADTTDFGILRLIVNDPVKAVTILKENGCTVNITEVIGIEIVDTPGGLATPLAILSKANIGLEYMYAFLSYAKDKAKVIFRVADNNGAIKVLNENGINTISSKDVYQ